LNHRIRNARPCRLEWRRGFKPKIDNQLMNAVIACGGTGGHLFPGIAVAEVLRDRGHEVMLLVSEKEIDALALSGRANFQFEKLPTVGLPSPFSPAILGFIRRFCESLSLCRSIYRKFKPQVVLGMGGFTSTAPLLAGRMRGVSTFIHESNAIPGKANRLTARMVRAVMLGFKECAPFFPKARTEVTGTPIRTELKPLDRQVARQRLGLRGDLPTLLVMGGSQGASGIFLERATSVLSRIIIAAKKSRPTSPLFIIEWRKFTVPPIFSWHAPARRVLPSSPLFRCRAF